MHMSKDNVTATVTVKLTGSAAVRVELTDENPTVQDAIASAAQHLGVNVNTATVSVIANGEQVEASAPVQDDDVVVAAANVVNG
jgi:hypothetical protein